jgi:hypothetical protein
MTMIKSLGLALLLAASVVASPMPELAKRASYSDPCNIGYCTQNGGYENMTQWIFHATVYLVKDD